MSVAYSQARKQKVRITLELNVFEDFNARDIDFEKLFKLEPAESVDVYVEEFDRYWTHTSDSLRDSYKGVFFNDLTYLTVSCTMSLWRMKSTRIA